jgi:hypothetical protein
MRGGRGSAKFVAEILAGRLPLRGETVAGRRITLRQAGDPNGILGIRAARVPVRERRRVEPLHRTGSKYQEPRVSFLCLRGRPRSRRVGASVLGAPSGNVPYAHAL